MPVAKLDIAPGYGPGDWGFESLQARFFSRSREAGPGEKKGMKPIGDGQDLDDYFMGEAIREAKKAAQSEDIPIGCVVVSGGKIVGRAHNQIELLKDATAHAEMIAITQAEEAAGDWRLSAAALYATKEPCPMCAGAILQARIKRVVFGARAPRDGAAGGAVDLLRNERLGSAVDCRGGVREAECAALLQSFFKTLRQPGRGKNRPE